jgi:uncharacterized membrane protein YccC
MQQPHLNGVGHRLEQCAALEYILMGDLRDLLEEPPDEENRRWLTAVLDALLNTLPREFALRQQGGYLSEVLEQYPSWYNQVESLRDEQRMLYAKLRQLRNRLNGDEPYEDIADELRSDLRDWMNALVAHHRHERRIVQTAYTLEVGAGD